MYTIGTIVSILSIWMPSKYPVVQTYTFRNTYQSQSPTTTTVRTSTIVAFSARYIEIPLLDFIPSNDNDDDDGPKKKEEILVQPLPSIHLQQQPELANIHVYGMKLTVPLHQQIINHAWDITATNIDANKIDLDEDLMPQRGLPYNDPAKIPLVGVIAYKPPTGSKDDSTKHSAIGTIGCAVQVLYNAAIMNNDEYKKNLNIDSGSNNDMTGGSRNKKKKKTIRYNTPSTSKTVLCRGLFRFIVRDIKQSIPYTVALVEELHDIRESEVLTTTSPNVESNTMINDSHANMTTTELMQRTLQSMQYVVDRMMEHAIQSSNQPLNPLEESILQDNGMIHQQQQARNEIRETAQEYNDIWNIFRSSLVDMSPNERYYSVPFMAAEICHFPNQVRRQMLVTTNPIERLRIACRAATTEAAATTTATSTRSTIKNPVVSTMMDGTVVDRKSVV